LGTEVRQLKVLVDARLASAFKEACRVSGVSMANDLSGYMAARSGMAARPPSQAVPVRTGTRRDRRAALHRVISMAAAIRDAEEAYMLRIPESLSGGPAYENAENAVCAIDEAIALLEGAFG